jgi:magnesium transporter
MRDLFARQVEVITDLAGLESDSHDYFRDIYDHLIRITDELDGYHEMVAGCTDLYLSTVANRQGETSKQLAIIASIFLPLSFLTGFFGMNFDWSIAHVLHRPVVVLPLGIGSMVLSDGDVVVVPPQGLDREGRPRRWRRALRGSPTPCAAPMS